MVFAVVRTHFARKNTSIFVTKKEISSKINIRRYDAIEPSSILRRDLFLFNDLNESISTKISASKITKTKKGGPPLLGLAKSTY